jgi:hypothetical protein
MSRIHVEQSRRRSVIGHSDEFSIVLRTFFRSRQVQKGWEATIHGITHKLRSATRDRDSDFKELRLGVPERWFPLA